ncbi:hypothetical protein ACN38_g11282 [Penicillium nordicum]|uniref:Uncharacterized protein n=2 Tax=Penicillium TaxID=5073 RepID=A0A0M8NZ19_9EURO|nr:hypothetical protein ACN38_g11282 [Penicillium nordicum]
MQSNASPLVRTTSLSSDVHGVNYSDPTIPDARSASEVDVDSRWEASRRFVNAPPPQRPMTSGNPVTTVRSGKNDQDDSHIKTIRSIGRKLTFRK